MEGAHVRKTKLVDLGGRWQAEIARPHVWVATRWARTLNDGIEAHEAAERTAMLEQGRSDSLPAAEIEKLRKEPLTVKLRSEHFDAWEREVYPHVVIAFIDPDGNRLDRKDVWLADLGISRFYVLMSAVSAWIREADESFRGEDVSG